MAQNQKSRSKVKLKFSKQSVRKYWETGTCLGLALVSAHVGIQAMVLLTNSALRLLELPLTAKRQPLIGARRIDLDGRIPEVVSSGQLKRVRLTNTLYR